MPVAHHQRQKHERETPIPPAKAASSPTNIIVKITTIKPNNSAPVPIEPSAPRPADIGLRQLPYVRIARGSLTATRTLPLVIRSRSAF